MAKKTKRKQRKTLKFSRHALKNLEVRMALDPLIVTSTAEKLAATWKTTTAEDFKAVFPSADLRENTQLFKNEYDDTVVWFLVRQNEVVTIKTASDGFFCSALKSFVRVEKY